MNALDELEAMFPTPKHLRRQKVPVATRCIGRINEVGDLEMDYSQWVWLPDPKAIGAELLARHRHRRAA